MTIDEKEQFCILIETYLHTSICYDLCERWKDGILKIAQEIKNGASEPKQNHARN